LIFPDTLAGLAGYLNVNWCRSSLGSAAGAILKLFLRSSSMRRLLLCLFCLPFATTLCGAEDAPENKPTSDEAAEIVAELLNRETIIQVEVTLLKVSGKPMLAAQTEMSAEDFADFLQVVTEDGRLVQQTSVKVSTLHNVATQVQLGRNEAVVSGQSVAFNAGTRSPRAVNAYRMESTGTLFRMTPSVTADGRVLVELAVEQSELAKVTPPPASEGSELNETPPAGTEIFSTKTTSKVTPGKTLVAGSSISRSGENAESIYILVRAEVRE
jgi:hypothetical protein